MRPRRRRDEMLEASLAVGLGLAAIAIAGAALAGASGYVAQEARRTWRHSRPIPERGSVPDERHRQTRSAAAR